MLKHLPRARCLMEELSTRAQDLRSWNTAISQHTRNHRWNDAFAMYVNMRKQGVRGDRYTFPCVLKACAALGLSRSVQEIHAHATKVGIISHVFVAGCVVNIYAKSARIKDARQLFDEMPHPDVIAWNSLITGYVRAGYYQDAMKTFREIGMKLDWATIPSIVSACGRLTALMQGKVIHSYVIGCGFDSDIVIGNALIDMYSRCGSLADAVLVFKSIKNPNVVTWTAMISGYGLHGHGVSALNLFKRMQEEGLVPNDVTFTATLSACSHSGLVKQGEELFDKMTKEYTVSPNTEHYACIVDLLGRSGNVQGAYNLIQRMPFSPDASVWGALLSACRMHCNVELGECASQRLFRLEPENAANYVALCSIYAASGLWEEVAKTRVLMKEKGLIKNAGLSWIEVGNMMHVFSQGDKSHLHSEKIYKVLNSLFQQIKEIGYKEETLCLPYNLDSREKKGILHHHSERLAIAFGILSTPPGTPIRIMKNLRICSDCHTAIKFFTKVLHREIIIRDALRFHYFNNGVCSCRDYW